MEGEPARNARVLPNLKISVPSKKKGRRSSKKVSNAHTFKSAGSAST